jgi:hypothetical protein
VYEGEHRQLQEVQEAEEAVSMIDVIVTMATVSGLVDKGTYKDGEFVKEETTAYPVTKVYRLEFETEEGFNEWLQAADERVDVTLDKRRGRFGLVASEQLIGADDWESLGSDDVHR